MAMTRASSEYCEAERHLKKASPILAEIIGRAGPCTLTPNPDVFRILIRSLISQFISTAAANSISNRLETKLNGSLTPLRILKLNDDELKACGISNSKAKSVRSVAEHFRKNRKFAKTLAEAEDPEAKKLLLPLYGVGPWTVDMVLIFSHARPDILPVGDFGLRAGVRDTHHLPELPDAKKLEQLAEPWRPFRTIATWYLWRSRDMSPP